MRRIWEELKRHLEGAGSPEVGAEIFPVLALAHLTPDSTSTSSLDMEYTRLFA